MQITTKQLKTLLKTLSDAGATDFDYRDEKYRLRLSFAGQPANPMVAVAPASAAAAATASIDSAPAVEEEEDGIIFVTSPFVGTFYIAPDPEQGPFAPVGATLKVGQTLCIVEAMKLMNEIESEVAGTVVEVLVDNGESVEFGQKLFKVKQA